MAINYKPLYWQQKRDARVKRGIEFLLTYDEWLKIWEESGRLHERGTRRGMYVMARFGDKGPYAVGNVKIITHEQNCSERRDSLETRAKKSRANIGHPVSAELRARIAAANRLRVWSAESRAKVGAAIRGRE